MIAMNEQSNSNTHLELVVTHLSGSFAGPGSRRECGTAVRAVFWQRPWNRGHCRHCW